MTKKSKSMAKIVSCIIFAAMMVLNLVLPAFAADYSTGTSSEDPAKAAITKVFSMPINTPTPASEFIFTFEKIGMNEPLDTTAMAGMPAIPDVPISFTSGEEPAGGTFVSGDTKSVVKESGNFLAGLLPSDWANGEGIYKYRVYENMTVGKSNITIVDAEKEGASYSIAKYDVEVWVEKDDNGILFPKFVCVKIVENFIDEYYEGSEGGEKVDPTPGGVKQVPGDPTIEDDFSQVIFTNKYWKTDGGGEPDPEESALEIIKKITGNGANLAEYFSFDVKVTQPSVIPTLQTYKAYVLDKGGNIVTSTDNFGTLETDDNGEKYIEFTSGVKLTEIKLTNEQRLAFADLHIGATVEAEEAASADYIPSYQRSFAGTSEFKGVKNAAFGFPRSTQDPGPHYIGSGAKTNHATFTNTRSGATPTGISVDNLPFIVLIGAAIAGLVGFVVVRTRKNAKCDI